MAVVVDVLRATTMMVHALAAGCEAVIPCGEIDEARQVAASLPPGTALLAGEREGLPIDGFDLGNSPRSCTPEVCRGKTLVMTTTNGTRAILASQSPTPSRVIVGAVPGTSKRDGPAAPRRRAARSRSSAPARTASSATRIRRPGQRLRASPARTWGRTSMNDEAEIVSGLWSKIDEVDLDQVGDGDRGPREESPPRARYLSPRAVAAGRVAELGLARPTSRRGARLNRLEHHLDRRARGATPLRIVAVRWMLVPASNRSPISLSTFERGNAGPSTRYSSEDTNAMDMDKLVSLLQEAAEASSSRRARSTGGSTASGTTARSAWSCCATSRTPGGATT